MILESGHSYRKVQPGKKDDNALFFSNEGGGKENNVDKRIADKFVRISNVLKDSRAEVDGAEETPENSLRAFTRSREVTPVDTLEISDAPTGDLFSRGNDQSDNSITTRDDVLEYRNISQLTDEDSPATPETDVPTDHLDFLSAISSTVIAPKDDSVDRGESVSRKPEEKSSTAVDLFLPSPIISAREGHVSKELSQEVDPDESTSPSLPSDSVTRRTGLFTGELPSGIWSDVVGHHEGATGYHENEEIAELVQRIVRQYAGYTPIMPGMPTIHEMTEAETLPPEDDITGSDQTTTTLATITKVTDAAFRPSISPTEYVLMPSPEEIHDEVSLDDSTFVDETEATTTVLVIISVGEISFNELDFDSDHRPLSNVQEALRYTRRSL